MSKTMKEVGKCKLCELADYGVRINGRLICIRCLESLENHFKSCQCSHPKLAMLDRGPSEPMLCKECGRPARGGDL